MVQEDKLSAVLSDFARTLVTDFPIQGILDHLVERIVEILPITAAGVTLISAGKAPRYVAASNDAALRFEKLQTNIWQGPCLEAYETGRAVSVPDLRSDTRFPKFAAEAVANGLLAVFTFPLSPGHSRLGALDLYRDSPGKLDEDDMDAAQTLADVTAAYLQNAQTREDVSATADYFHHSSLHDPLTKLPNRVLLHQRLEHAAQRAHRSNTFAAILFADLDRFKQVNDTHGHRMGDELLIAVAERLSALVRPGDTLARVSGDEFVFLCEDLESTSDADILAERIGEAFERPFILSDRQFTISASIGLAFAGPGEGVSDQLVVDADIAMYQAKRKGGARHQVIDLREAMETDDRNTLESDLRVALQRNQLDLAYQPIVDVADGRVIGVEALLRWTDTDRGTVSPMLMIAAAEQSNLINEVGEWVLKRSCSDQAQWLQRYPSAPLLLAINVSPRQLMSQGFIEMVNRSLKESDTQAQGIIFEVTENIFVEDSERAMGILADLGALGVSLALDDFGTGYSSLSYLHRLPIQTVKVDQSFVGNMATETADNSIVEAITRLSHVLGFSVCAEGIETQMQHDEIVRIGCDTAQGYFYARPMTANAISDLLESSPIRPLHLPLQISTTGARS
jgi:diguanylate cyclase (GGDEF)-like protein